MLCKALVSQVRRPKCRMKKVLSLMSEPCTRSQAPQGILVRLNLVGNQGECHLALEDLGSSNPLLLATVDPQEDLLKMQIPRLR